MFDVIRQTACLGFNPIMVDHCYVADFMPAVILTKSCLRLQAQLLTQSWLITYVTDCMPSFNPIMVDYCNVTDKPSF